ncbi:MAG: hypothetical protein ACO1TE_14210 [Prosthecobacter sp.]
MTALITITQGNGTFNATARISGKVAARASCTMGREQAALSAAVKAFNNCPEKRVKLTQGTREDRGSFTVRLVPGLSEEFSVRPNTDSVFCAELVPEFTEALTWHTEGRPDAETTVLIQDTDHEVGEGFWDGECWRWASTTRVRAVKAWADMPGGVP